MANIDDLIKHDKYVETLCAQIEPHYDVLYKHIPIYSTKRRSRRTVMLGEIDIIAFKGDYYDIFEVKCSRRITKAKKQLVRIRKALDMDKKLRNAFFFCGESGEMHTI